MDRLCTIPMRHHEFMTLDFGLDYTPSDMALVQYLIARFSLDRKTAEAIAYLFAGYVRMRSFTFDATTREKGLTHHLTKFVKDGLVLCELMEFVRWLDDHYWSLSFKTQWWKYLDEWEKE